MIRIFFLYILPLLLPTIIYLSWLKKNIKRADNAEYKIIPLPLLLIFGVILAAVILTAFLTESGSSGDVTYVRAKYENGKVISGRIEEKPKEEQQ